MTLVQRTFSQNIPLEKTAFRDGKRYEAIRKAFERDLSDRDIVGGERADVVEALMSCLEHHPKVANLEYTENLFPVLRTAIEREDEREKSKIASDEQFRALKWLAKAVRYVKLHCYDDYQDNDMIPALYFKVFRFVGVLDKTSDHPTKYRTGYTSSLLFYRGRLLERTKKLSVGSLECRRLLAY